jgi:phosphoglycerate dehydrogenase-like enzyme
MAEVEVNVLLVVPFPEPLIERLRAVSPRLKIRAVPARSAEDVPADVLQSTEVLYTSHMVPEPQDAPELRWIQFHYAGIDHALDNPLISNPDIQVTTLSGAAAPQMAEFALMGMLTLGRRTLRMVADQRDKIWAEKRFERYDPLMIRGSTIGIVGYGSVGREIARLGRAMGARILATKRDVMSVSNDEYERPDIGDPQAELAERLYPPEATASMLAECDFAVICVPLTPKTRGLIGAKVFKQMKPTSGLIDISRGGVVDHGALVEALNEGQIAGAVLDVYPVEPLPESSPLWVMPNVLISPHVAGASPSYAEQAVELFGENLRRYLAEQPLLNLYDPKRGY